MASSTPAYAAASSAPDALPPLPPADRRWLLAAMAAYVVLTLAFYPVLYTSIDEASTFGFAYILRHGTIYPEQTPIYRITEFFPELSPPGPHGRVYFFPIGFPALLSLLTGAGWRAFFLVNPVLHLLAAGCFARLLQACRLPPRDAILYLLFPCYVLFTRTLFSDAFAASLTTIALYFLYCRRSVPAAGLCLGLALTARSASIFVTGILLLALLVGDFRRRAQVPLWRGDGMRLLLTLLPFLAINLLYNNFAMGSPFQSTYSSKTLSWQGFAASAPTYALALLLVYPGMLLAPFFYRGKFWKEGLICTTVVWCVAAAYNESTFGNNTLQTLLSTPRQVLPVMPFYLLAYCGLLSRLLPASAVRRARLEGAAATLLLGIAIGIAAYHQKYLRSLRTIQTEIVRAVPPGATVYANKDTYKLYQPVWDKHLYRELPYVSSDLCRADLQKGPVYVVLYIRNRNFAGEDQVNARILGDIRARFLMKSVPVSGSGQVQYYRITGLRNTENVIIRT